MELLAQLSLEIGGHVGLFLELISSVRVRAARTKLAFAVHVKISTKLSLLLRFIRILELLPLFSTFEGLLLASSCGFTEVVFLMFFYIRATGCDAFVIIGHILYMYIVLGRLLHNFCLYLLIVINSNRVSPLKTVVAHLIH